MNRIIIIIWSLLCLSSVELISQSQHKLLRQGDKAYKKNDFSTAEEVYKKSLEIASSPKGSFNLGNTLYEQGRYEEAVEAYQSAIINLPSDVEKSQALYNMGNAQFKNQDLKASISSYRDALRLNPTDPDIRANLLNASVMMKNAQQQEQEQEPQDNQEQEQSDEEQEEQDSEEQEQQEQEEGEQEKSEEQEQSEEESTEEAQDSLNQANQSEMPDSLTQEMLDSMMMMNVSKEEALRLLQIAEKEEKKVQDKLIRVDRTSKKPKKDW